MASIRERRRASGDTAYAVLYTYNGHQTSATFDAELDAKTFRDSINAIGAEKSMTAWGIAPTAKASIARTKAPPLTQWLNRYVDSRTGVTKATIYDYRSYIEHDIANTIGPIPLDLLSRDDVAAWVEGLAARKLSGKTIANRHGFLSAALNAAVEAGLIPSNPAAKTRLPRSEKAEMVFLDHDEYDLLRTLFTAYWRPMLDFMVVSGARFGELTALRPSDVDRKRGTVHIGRAWKRTYDKDGYELGATKTKRSARTISIDRDVLAELDYTNEWLFVNTAGQPVRASSFRNNVWYPAVKKAQAKGLTKRPRIHDMRHTCASWMVQGGESLAVVQAHLGHESINTTIGLYTHLDRASADSAAARLGGRLKRAVPDVLS